MDRIARRHRCRTTPVFLLALLGAATAAGDEPRTWVVNDSHAEAVLGVAFAPDGRTLATWSRDGTAKFWDLARGRMRAAVPVRRGSTIHSVAFSPDGSIVATGASDPASEGEGGRAVPSGRLDFWDAATDAHLRTIQTPTINVHRIAFAPGGRRVGTLDADGKARTWNVATGKMLTETSLPASHGPAAFGPDLATLAVADDKKGVILIEAATAREVARLGDLPHRPQSLAFSPDGRWLACGSGKPSSGSFRGIDSGPVVVKVWDVSADPPRAMATLEGLDFEVSSLVFSPDGTTLVAGGFGARAIAWDVASGARRATLQASCNHLYALAFAPDGKTLAGVGLAPRITLWDAETWSPSDRLDGHRALRVAYVPDGKTLAVGFDDGTVALRDLKEGRTRVVLQSATFPGYGITALATSRDRGLVAAGFERGGVALWDPATGAYRGGLGFHHLGEVTALAFAPDGRAMASGGKEGTVRLWSPAHRELAALPGHSGRVVGLAFAGDSKTLASAGADGVVKLWDVDGRRERASVTVHTARLPRSKTEEIVIDGRPSIRSVPVPGEFEDSPVPLESLALSPDGATVATGDAWFYRTGEQISIRDMVTGRERIAFTHDREPLASMVSVVALAFSPDGQRIASAGYETIQVADVATGRVLRKLRRPGLGPIRDMAFAPDGRSVSACGWDTVWTWDLSDDGPPPAAGAP